MRLMREIADAADVPSSLPHGTIISLKGALFRYDANRGGYVRFGESPWHLRISGTGGPGSSKRITPATTAAIFGTRSAAADTIWGTYLPSSHESRVTKLGVYVDTATPGGELRVAVYDCLAGLEPNALLGETGVLDASVTGLLEETVSIDVEPGSLLFVAINSNDPAILPMTVGLSHCFPYLGHDSSGVAAVGLEVAHPFGAFPASFPGGATPVQYGPAVATVLTLAT